MDALWCSIIKTLGLPALAVFLLWIVLTQIKSEEYFKGKHKMQGVIILFKGIITMIVVGILVVAFLDARKPFQSASSDNIKAKTSVNK